jgi:hypothetical protein
MSGAASMRATAPSRPRRDIPDERTGLVGIRQMVGPERETRWTRP